MSRKLQGMAAWISGATSGIGEATARRFAAEGAAVAVTGIQPDQGRRIVAEIETAGGRAAWIPCDVADEDDIRHAVDAAAHRFGQLDIVVNNAGFVQIGALHEATAEQWDRLMAVNVRAIFLSLKYAFPYLRQQNRSYVVNVASISSFVGQSSTPAYTTSKHAVLGLTRSIALDYAAYGLRCNCVCPGITDTPMLREHLHAHGDPEQALRDRLKRVPMGVPLAPADIARSILYFSCDDSFGITGQSLIIDGGYLAAAEWEHPGHTAFMET